MRGGSRSTQREPTWRQEDQAQIWTCTDKTEGLTCLQWCRQALIANPYHILKFWILLFTFSRSEEKKLVLCPEPHKELELCWSVSVSGLFGSICTMTVWYLKEFWKCKHTEQLLYTKHRRLVFKLSPAQQQRPAMAAYGGVSINKHLGLSTVTRSPWLTHVHTHFRGSRSCVLWQGLSRHNQRVQSFQSWL